MKSFTSLFMMALVCVLVVSATTSLQAQGFRLKISCSDSQKLDTLTLGEDPAGTYGLDPALGEVESPVAPPDKGAGGGVFDIRCVSIYGDTAGFGVGRKVDVRQYSSATQTDTFEVQFQSSLTTDGGQAMQFSWNPSDLGGFRWRILDASLTTTMDNMGSGSSYTIPLSYYFGSDPAYTANIFIVKSASSKFRSFCYETLALDGAGKQGKSVKEKPWHAYFTSSFQNPITNLGPNKVNELVLKCGTPVDPLTFVITPTFPSIVWDSKNVVATCKLAGSDTIPAGQSYSISGVATKAKDQKITVITENNDVAKPKSNKAALTVTSVMLLPMPNTVNLGEYLFTTNQVDPTNGIVVGTVGSLGQIKGKDYFRYITNPKYKDVLKSMAKGTTLHTGADSLSTSGGKLIVKPTKTLAPDKASNKLFADALTLKLNIMFSNIGCTPNGFGNLSVVNSDGGAQFTPFVGKKFSDISNYCDSVLTLGNRFGHDTYANIDFVVSSINCAFDAAFDTASWGGGTTPGQPVTTGARFASDYSWIGLGSTAPSVVQPMLGSLPVFPEQYSLGQNYPNPFNPTTKISFTLPDDGLVTITVFNLLGQQVATLANQEQYTAGVNEVEFNASNYASGVYFYRINVNDPASGELLFTQVQKMMLIK